MIVDLQQVKKLKLVALAALAARPVLVNAELTLKFSSAPVLVGDSTNSSGPWYGRVNRLSDTHALGALADGRTVATTDAGYTWTTLEGWHNETGAFGGIYDNLSGEESFHNAGEALEYESATGRNVNVTGVRAPSTTRFSLDLKNATSPFVHAADKPFAMTGLPSLSGFRAGTASASLRLPDGRMLATAVTQGVGNASYAGKLSLVALHSDDGGYNWRYTSVVAAAEQVPYAREGPSENALAFLRNGSVLCVFRVAGESGHHSPYVSAVSDDRGATWHSLRSLPRWDDVATSDAPGCVRPRLATFGAGSLVLAGGRPNAASHDDLLWLNQDGDGERWRPFSVSYYHNLLTKNASWLIPERSVNASRWPRYDTSYSSLVKTGENSGYIYYGAGARSFALHFQLEAESTQDQEREHILFA